jgi:hypothetical protein
MLAQIWEQYGGWVKLAQIWEFHDASAACVKHHESRRSD